MITRRTPITGIGLAFSARNHGLDSRANAHRAAPSGLFSTELSTDGTPSAGAHGKAFRLGGLRPWNTTVTSIRYTRRNRS